MRKSILFTLTVFLFIACNTNDEKAGLANADSTNTSTASLPYPVGYSSEFKMIDHKYSPIIMNMWKDWDNNELDKSNNYFADSVVMDFDGSSMSGSRDSLTAKSKEYRGMFKTVTSEIDAVFSVASSDKNEDWVCIWGREKTVDSKGKLDSTAIHELWRFNKNGKIDYMSQYLQHYPKTASK